MFGEVTRVLGFCILTFSVFACLFMTNRRKRNAFTWFVMALVLPVTGFVMLLI